MSPPVSGPTLDSPARVTLHIKGSEQFWEHYFDDGQRRGFFLPHVLDVPVGAAAQLELIFIDRDARFKLGGVVIWRRLRGQLRGRHAPGCCLAVREPELPKLERALAYAQGKAVAFVRRDAPRITAAFEVRYQAASAFMSDFSRDLSASGLFLQTDQPLAIGTELQLRLRVPGRFWPLTLQGRVVRRDPDGVAIAFHFRSDKERARLSALVTRVAARIRAQLDA